jgi:hypothetical protein
MAENKLKHLDLIQTTLHRFARNSFQIKGWTVALVSAMFVFAAGKGSQEKATYMAIAFLPVVMFWILDAYFLWQERLYWALYNEVIKKKESEIDFSMKPSKTNGRNTWTSALFAKHLEVFYLSLVGVMVLVSFAVWRFSPQ